MKKLLPRTKYTPQGFTLIELLIAISILAILSMIGMVGFGTVQKNSRDAKRKADIEAMAAAMEANYVTGVGYASLSSTWFAGSALPTNPGPGGTTYYTNTPATTGYTFCALLEQSNGNSNSSSTFTSVSGGTHYCREKSQ